MDFAWYLRHGCFDKTQVRQHSSQTLACRAALTKLVRARQFEHCNVSVENISIFGVAEVPTFQFWMSIERSSVMSQVSSIIHFLAHGFLVSLTNLEFSKLSTFLRQMDVLPRYGFDSSPEGVRFTVAILDTSCRKTRQVWRTCLEPSRNWRKIRTSMSLSLVFC